MKRRFDGRFAFQSAKSILKPAHLAVSGNRVSVRTPFDSVTALETLQAPPYANTDFWCEVKIAGEALCSREYTWRVNLLERRGSTEDFRVTCQTVIPPNKNAVVQAVTVENTAGKDLNIPLELWYRGCTEYVQNWVFSPPKAACRSPLKTECTGRMLTAFGPGDAAFAVTSSVEMEHFPLAGVLKTRVTIPAGESCTYFFSLHSGQIDTVLNEAAVISEDYDQAIDEAFLWAESEEQRLLRALPAFACDDEAYTAFYYRSLVTLLLNRWEIPLFKLNPYYSTGGTTGGCMCAYLWDYAGPWNIHPLVDPQVTREEIKAFLAVDLSTSYAIMPVDGQKTGPWYQINQEKIIALIYHYLANTGDVAFLDEMAGEKSVIDWVRFHAWFGDDPEKEAVLIDYGEKGEDHLELRRGIPYHGVMPDLNMRRYKTYERASEILALYGTPDSTMLQRAANVAKLTKQELWDAEHKWFRFRIGEKDDLRYTVQMFKFLDSDACDNEIRAGLLSHLNEEEFLSDFGLHSMSKLDEAYDQVDIDNGGGGICSLFVPVILEQLYRIGACDIANDIFRRVLWWGQRLPYWGDSLVANAVAYREDTPLQATIGSSAGAQMMIFGIFGVKAAFDGTVTVCPVSAPPAKNMRLTDMKLRGKNFSISLGETTYTVLCGGQAITKNYGEATVLP